VAARALGPALVDDSRELRFFAPSALIEQRENFFNYASRAINDRAGKRFHAEYGVSLGDLMPVAEPADVSSRLLIHLGKGEKFGCCYLWSHEDIGVLEAEQPSFTQALEALTQASSSGPGHAHVPGYLLRGLKRSGGRY